MLYYITSKNASCKKLKVSKGNSLNTFSEISLRKDIFDDFELFLRNSE